VADRNITIDLPDDLIRRAVDAARQSTTVTAMVRKLLESVLASEERMRAGQRFLAIAHRGPYTNVDPGTIRREELYERW
jgi:hypothetical protein